MEKLNVEERGAKAVEIFDVEDFNCAQAVYLAFNDLYDVDRRIAIEVASSLGGGMAIGEVCGALSASLLVVGHERPFANPQDKDSKQLNKDSCKQLAEEFQLDNGSLYCRNLKEEGPDYKNLKKRSCSELVRHAAMNVARHINEWRGFKD